MPFAHILVPANSLSVEKRKKMVELVTDAIIEAEDAPWFVRAAADAGAADPRLLGEQLMLLFDGALIGATTRRSAQAAPSARRAAEILLAGVTREVATAR